VAVTCTCCRGEGLRGGKDSIGGDGADLRGAAGVPLTLQKTECLRCWPMMAEK